MSQRGVEIAIGRLVADEAIRERFARAPRETLREVMQEGIELNHVELVALERLDPKVLASFASTLDPRLLKIVLVPFPDDDGGKDA
jgi:hypothetical protein